MPTKKPTDQQTEDGTETKIQRVKRSFYIDPDLYAELCDEAQRHYLTISDAIEEACRRYLESLREAPVQPPRTGRGRPGRPLRPR